MAGVTKIALDMRLLASRPLRAGLSFALRRTALGDRKDDDRRSEPRRGRVQSDRTNKPSTCPIRPRCLVSRRQRFEILVGFFRHREPREQIQRLVEAIGDAAGEGRNALRGAHDVEHMRRRRLQQRIGPAGHILRVIPDSGRTSPASRPGRTACRRGRGWRRDRSWRTSRRCSSPAGDRIVEHDDVGHAEHGFAGRQRARSACARSARNGRQGCRWRRSVRRSWRARLPRAGTCRGSISIWPDARPASERPSQQSIGPPGMPSNTMISHGPVVVSDGKTKYSPTPGMRLKQTAECCGRGVSPLT